MEKDRMPIIGGGVVIDRDPATGKQSRELCIKKQSSTGDTRMYPVRDIGEVDINYTVKGGLFSRHAKNVPVMHDRAEVAAWMADNMSKMFDASDLKWLKAYAKEHAGEQEEAPKPKKTAEQKKETKTANKKKAAATVKDAVGADATEKVPEEA